MTKHRLLCTSGWHRFPELQILIEEAEELGWQAIPPTLILHNESIAILMFKVESNSPYRTEASHPSAPIPDYNPVPYPLKK